MSPYDVAELVRSLETGQHTDCDGLPVPGHTVLHQTGEDGHLRRASAYHGQVNIDGQAGDLSQTLRQGPEPTELLHPSHGLLGPVVHEADQEVPSRRHLGDLGPHPADGLLAVTDQHAGSEHDGHN